MRRARLRRAPIVWGASALLLLGLSVAAVVVANATAFSASAFVQVYLGALARGDAAAAAAVPGVTTGGLDRAAIAPTALPGLSRIRIVSDTEVAPGRHRIEATWTSRGTAGRTTFDVEADGTRLLLFPAWRFAAPPVARLTATPLGETRYRVGTAELDSAPGTRVALLVPGVYRVDVDSPVATSRAVGVTADRAVALTAAPRGHATPRFQDAVEREIRTALDHCATEKSLFPSGCPFGADITDRIVSTPAWTIVDDGSVALAPTATPGVWSARLDGGLARLHVKVQSLFDGSIGARAIDSPVSGTYRVVVDGDDPVLGGFSAAGG